MKRIAWVSPVDQERGLRSAAFSRRVLTCALRSWEIDIFVDDDGWKALCRGGVQPTLGIYSVYHYHRLFERDSARPYDCFVYQLEDHAACSYVERCTKLWPGVCWFHDLNLNNLYYSKFSHSTAAKDINELMDEEFGPRSARLGDYHVRKWSSAVFDRQYPCGRKELKSAAVAVVQNRAALEYVKSLQVECPVYLSSFPVAVPQVDACLKQRDMLRSKLGFSPDEHVLGFAGSSELGDGVSRVLRAFAALCQRMRSERGAGVRMLWVVDPAKCRWAEAVLCSAAAEEIGLKEAVRVVDTNYCEEILWLFSVPDVFVAPRLDSLRGVSFGVLDSLACAVPVVVTDYGPGADIPQDAAIHLLPGEGESGLLSSALWELLTNGALRVSVGKAGRSYSAMSCTPELVWRDLAGIVEEQEEHIAQLLSKQGRSIAKEQTALLDGAKAECASKQFDISGQNGEQAKLDLWRRIGRRAAADFGWEKTV